jgi:hypothetical protein
LIVSVCPIDGDTPWRKALETVAIAEHRQQHGVSPPWNFGRMPAGFRMSSANNAALVAAVPDTPGAPSVSASSRGGGWERGWPVLRLSDQEP